MSSNSGRRVLKLHAECPSGPAYTIVESMAGKNTRLLIYEMHDSVIKVIDWESYHNNEYGSFCKRRSGQECRFLPFTNRLLRRQDKKIDKCLYETI